MTLPPAIRIFFAIDLPLSAKEKIGSFIGALKKKSKSNAIRWTKPENLHITLQFLAEIKAADLPELVRNVRGRLARLDKSSTIKLGTLHLFPTPYRPRVIVLDVAPQEQLASLAELIGHGIKATGYEVEDRPFRGHLTLGRIKQPQGIQLGFLNEVELPAIEEIELNEVVAFRSEPQPEGSVYTPLERINLSSGR
ncbi:RNA 2',3'-cyclic phosphodiesterase [Aquicella lusitana]|uniref:RNA 2',3'-cyclic phosphodiesterase n=1 Tax=Aquicella lusitana TaxID=254246 RepID=A0A370GC80_9COXI|nr:RNA 2',3'-cyclic phosphodiesterase [Aquicella lusitana]RDI40064.1 2'-5' RNA ligase [Aquicella lusitana]VVC72344.1 RNA 2',3'-cyclic phosphodiesterase [Aquicella lusitana]